VQAEAVRSHEHFAGSHSRADIALEDFTVMLVGNQDHNEIGLFRRIGWRHDTQTFGLGLLAALAAFRQTDYYITTIVAHVERMSMALASVTNDRYMFALDKFQIRIGIVINICHSVSSLLFLSMKA
jgi:hypothetical protein